MRFLKGPLFNYRQEYGIVYIVLPITRDLVIHNTNTAKLHLEKC